MDVHEQIELQLSKKQQVFYDAVMRGENVFLKGKAGTGKSHVTRAVMQALNAAGKNVAALAPTGVAANNINGATLHSTFSLTPFGIIHPHLANYVKSSKRHMLRAIDVLFIDEVSMTRPDWIDALEWTLLKNNCGHLADKQIVFIGDMKQLGIVADDNMMSVLLKEYGGPEFWRAETYKRLNVTEIDLDEVLRQSDQEFIEALNIVREGGKSPYFKKFVKETAGDGVILAPHNATVQRYNFEGLAAIDGPEYTFKAVTEGKVTAADFNVDIEIRVKDGAKIMYLANSQNNNLYNGALGTFRVQDSGTKDERYFIEIDSVKYALENYIFTKKDYVLNPVENKLELMEIGKITQLPIKLAYAMTIHKSQGLTFDEITIDLTLPCFAEGQTYVALSRVRSPEGLTIIANRKP